MKFNGVVDDLGYVAAFTHSYTERALLGVVRLLFARHPQYPFSLHAQRAQIAGHWILHFFLPKLTVTFLAMMPLQ